MKRTKGVTLTSLVISIAILLIIVTFAVNVGFENIQKAKVESFKNDAKIISEVIEVLRLKIESFPDIQKNSYLNRLTLNLGINANELNNYLKSKSQSYTNLHQDLRTKGINPKYISMNSLKNIYEEIMKLEFKLGDKDNMQNICVEYYSGEVILIPNKQIPYMGKEIRVLADI